MTRILAISGSLRAESFNTALVNALQPFAPEGMQIEVYKGLDELPHFNQDLEANPPASVVRLREAIAEADGLIITTPEYNRSLPGVLKNALDWASRPYARGVLAGKSIVAMSASPGVQGGIRALIQLKTLLRDLNNFVVSGPEISVPEVHTRLGVEADVQHVLTDPATAGMVTHVLAGLQDAIDNNAGELVARPLGAWAASTA
ncbi:NAD(P)H-dependent oxidoreductase [Embleya sp. NBC_00888]|uniref:NADPH-dependent FMN reductase n=1 Tax=Embleya sp. NBC_00888 TaxID=2975960 RepID=UPI00386F29B4|nr:NAD(P)H-dependent oxidoreductase [Embleya sp. NBC_00888]